jgi:hypothetical protein
MPSRAHERVESLNEAFRYSLRFGAWLLGKMFQWLYNGEIFINTAITAQLRELASSSTLVCVFPFAMVLAGPCCRSVLRMAGGMDVSIHECDILLSQTLLERDHRI